MADYKAFISYCRQEDRAVASRIQHGVERYASKWYRIKAFRIFLDKRSLTPGPELWPSIFRAMDRCEWLIFVASRPAVDSEGVNTELEWWLDEKSAEKLLIVDSEDVLAWKGTGFTDPLAVPPALRRALKEQPNLVKVAAGSGDASELSDDDFRSTVIDVAAALRETDRDLLVDREDREQKARNWFVRGTIAILSVLLVVAAVAVVLAFHERSVADARASVSLSRQVATASESAAGTDLDAAMLLVVQAFRIDANPQTRAALIHADVASPGLVRFLVAAAKVTALTASRERGFVIAGLADGTVLRWNVHGGRPERLLKLSRKVVSLATNDDGSVVAASDVAKGKLWRSGHGSLTLTVPRGTHCDAVGLSPSGRTVVYAARRPDREGGTITVAPVTDPALGRRHPDPIETETIVVPSDRRTLLLGPPEIAWEKFSAWSRHSTSEPGFGAHTFAFATSADGRWVTDTNGSSPIPVWHTATDIPLNQEAEAYAEAPLTAQGQLAISPDGKRLAVVGPGQIYVAPIVKTSPVRSRIETLQRHPAESPVSLTGQEPELVSFATDSRLVSVAGKEIAIWDTGQIDRLVETEKVPLEFSCEECGPPQLSISPNGRRLAIINGSNSFALIQSLDGGHRVILPKSEIEYAYGSPVWRGNGGIVAFPIWPAAGASRPSFPGPQSLPSYVRLWPAGRGDDRELADGPREDGDEAVVVDTEGNAFLQDTLTGTVLASRRQSRIGVEEDDTAATNPAGTLLAVAEEGEVRVERLPDRALVSHFSAPGLTSLVFAAGHLLALRSDGVLEVRDETGETLQRTIAGGSDAGWLAASPTGNLVARSLTDGSIAVEELATGSRIATLSTPGGSFFVKTGLAFAPTGNTLVSLTESGESEEGELVRRNLGDAALIETACAAAGRSLDDAEWRALVGTDPPADLRCSTP